MSLGKIMIFNTVTQRGAIMVWVICIHTMQELAQVHLMIQKKVIQRGCLTATLIIVCGCSGPCVECLTLAWCVHKQFNHFRNKHFMTFP